MMLHSDREGKAQAEATCMLAKIAWIETAAVSMATPQELLCYHPSVTEALGAAQACRERRRLTANESALAGVD